jgi:S-adenosylmethionine synthetase
VFDGKTTNTGSLVRMEKVLVKYPNGEVDIAVKGVDIVTIKTYEEEHFERLYPHGDIEVLNKKLVKASAGLLEIFEKYNEKILKADLGKYEVNFYLIANSIGLSDYEKYDILRRENEHQMNKMLINYLRFKTIIATQKNSIQEFYCLN